MTINFIVKYYEHDPIRPDYTQKSSPNDLILQNKQAIEIMSARYPRPNHFQVPNRGTLITYAKEIYFEKDQESADLRTKELNKKHNIEKDHPFAKPNYLYPKNPEQDLREVIIMDIRPKRKMMVDLSMPSSYGWHYGWYYGWK